MVILWNTKGMQHFSNACFTAIVRQMHDQCNVFNLHLFQST